MRSIGSVLEGITNVINKVYCGAINVRLGAAISGTFVFRHFVRRKMWILHLNMDISRGL